MNFLNKTAYRVLLGLFGTALFIMLLVPYTDTGFVEPLSVILLAIGLFFILRWVYRKLITLPKRTLRYLIAGAFVLLLAGQIFVLNLSQTNVFGDPWHIQMQAARLSQGDHTWDIWIKTYPNLLPLVMLSLGFIKLSSLLHLSYYAILWTFNIGVVLAIWAVVTRFLWKKKPVLAAFMMMLAVVLPFNYTFLLELGYSDGIAILSLVSLITIFDTAYERGKFSLWQGLLTAIIFTVAYLARPNVIIFIVALLIVGVYAYVARKKLGRLWLQVGKMLLACVIGILLAMGASRGLAKSVDYNLKNADALPTIHWIYMGLNEATAGEWTPTDVAYSTSHTGYPTTSAADMAGIKKRLASNNVTLPLLWLAKFGTLWSAGTFATSTDYQLYAWGYHWVHAPGFIVKNIGAINIFIQVYSKALIGLLLFAILARIRREKKAEINSFGLMLLTIMGISLFHSLIWEVKPRYQFMTIGLLLLAAALSVDRLFGENAAFVKPEKKAVWKKRLKIGVSILSVLSIILMSTVMQLQPGQQIIVTGIQHPTDNYGYSPDDLHLAPGQTVSQDLTLTAPADQFVLQTGTTADLQLTLQRNVSGNWTHFDSRTISIDKIDPVSSTQTFAVKMPVGQYRILVKNPNSSPATIEAFLNPISFDYPTHITLPNGQTASFGFTFSQSQTQPKYSIGLIVLVALLEGIVVLLVYKL